MSLAQHRSVVSLIGIFAISGCTTMPERALVTAAGGAVAIAPARFEPETNFNEYALGKGTAAARMGAGGAAEGAAFGAIAPLANPYTIWAYPLIAPFTIIAGAVVGGAAGVGIGTMHGLTEEDADALHKAVDKALASLKMQEAMALRISEATKTIGRPLVWTDSVRNLAPRTDKEQPDYRAVIGAPFSAILETSMMSVRLSAKKGEPKRIALEMTLRVRGVDSVSATSRQFEYKSRPRPVSEWADKGGALIQEELEIGYRELADDVAAWLVAVPPS